MSCPLINININGDVYTVHQSVADEIDRLKKRTELYPTLCYICAECGAFAYVDCDSLDSGTTFTCDSCNGKTVVSLDKPGFYKEHFELENENSVLKSLRDELFDRKKQLEAELKASYDHAASMEGSCKQLEVEKQQWIDEVESTIKRVRQLEDKVVTCKSIWFKKGQESIKRKNQSGCCCVINDNDEIETSCGLHKPYIEKAQLWDYLCAHTVDCLWAYQDSPDIKTAVKAAKEGVKE